MLFGVLEKIESTHNNLRTSSMEGAFEIPPKIGDSFNIFGKGLEFGNRIISTSTVVEILEEDESHILFKTLYSTYKLNLMCSKDDDLSSYLTSCHNGGTQM